MHLQEGDEAGRAEGPCASPSFRTNATASASVMVLSRFLRCARASGSDNLNGAPVPLTMALAYMRAAYASEGGETNDRSLPFTAADPVGGAPQSADIRANRRRRLTP